MGTTASDLQNAERTIADSRSIRLAVEHEAILAGAWEGDIVDKLMTEHGESLSVENGRVAGVKGAIDAYRTKNPDGFCKLGPLANNEKLPAMTRFAASYRDCLKARDRKKQLTSAQSRGMLRVRKEAS